MRDRKLCDAHVGEFGRTPRNMLLTDVKAYGLASASGGRDRYWCLIVGR
jgi:hypothetical protein